MKSNKSAERTVWQIDRAGSLDRLQQKSEILEKVGPEEVRVECRAIGLNFADIFACLGLYSATPRGAFIPGLEFAGTVAATGARVKKFRTGQKVIGVTRFGGYATHVTVDERALLPLPARWSFEEGAALLAQGLTAYYALFELGALKKDQVVLVHSAAGGVGLLALEMIERSKARALATIGSRNKVDFLKERAALSEEQILVRPGKSSDFREQLQSSLKQIGQSHLDLVLDSVMGPYFWPGYDALGPGGRLILFGAADLMPTGKRPNYARLGWAYLRRPRLDPLSMISENKSLMAFNLIWLWDRVAELDRMARQMLALKIRPPFIRHRFPFDQAPEAMRLFQSGKTVGKVVLVL